MSKAAEKMFQTGDMSVMNKAEWQQARADALAWIVQTSLQKSRGNGLLSSANLARGARSLEELLIAIAINGAQTNDEKDFFNRLMKHLLEGDDVRELLQIPKAKIGHRKASPIWPHIVIEIDQRIEEFGGKHGALREACIAVEAIIDRVDFNAEHIERQYNRFKNKVIGPKKRAVDLVKKKATARRKNNKATAGKRDKS